MADTNISAASKVFHLPELLELILLALPCDTTHQELAALRTIRCAQTVTRTWHAVLATSTAMRRKLYLPAPSQAQAIQAWQTPSAFPPAEPNPWIPFLLLNQRSWGVAWPFDHASDVSNASSAPARQSVEAQMTFQPSPNRFWPFTFELSQAQWERLPAFGSWCAMQAASPPFTAIWCSRAIYELGGVTGPFVELLDWDPRTTNEKQRWVCRRDDGITLGDIRHAMDVVFGEHADTRFVRIESFVPVCKR